MRINLFLFLGTSVLGLAQIEGPRLGFASRGGELRRIEGLSVSSRLSGKLDLPVACSRISAAPGAAMRWALCASESATLLVDLRDMTSRVVLEAPFENAVWSAGGTAALLNGRVRLFDLENVSSEVASGDFAAISDSGAVLEGALSFDGETALSVQEQVLRRGEEAYTLDFAPERALSWNGAVYAVRGQRLARVDRKTAQVEYFDLAVEATTLSLLADGSLLLRAPAEDEPGWLFRWSPEEGGSVRFIPGVPAVEVAQ